MKKIIILFAGQARAGKDTCADMVLDICREQGIYATKTYFAKALKDSAKKCLGLTDEHLYGSLKEEMMEYKLSPSDIFVNLAGEIHHGSLISLDGSVRHENALTISKNITNAMCKAVRENAKQTTLNRLFKTDTFILSPRQLMQWWGTEAVRQGAYEDAWVDCVKFDIGMHDSDVTVVSDARFGNEVEEIREGFPNHDVVVVQVVRPGNVKVAAHASESGLSADLIDYVVENNGDLENLKDIIGSLFLAIRSNSNQP